MQERQHIVHAVGQRIIFVVLLLDVAHPPAPGLQGVPDLVPGVPVAVAVVHVEAGERYRDVVLLLGPELSRAQAVAVELPAYQRSPPLLE